MGQPGREMTEPHVHFNENTTRIENDYVQAVPQNAIIAEGNGGVPAENVSVQFTEDIPTVDIEQAQVVPLNNTDVTSTTLLPGLQ